MGRLSGPQTLVIGELNVDIVATGIRSTPEMGTETLAKDCVLTLGSASAIFAVGMAKLGHHVTFVSQVGTDSFGDFCIDALQRSGVSTRNVAQKDKLKTGVTIALSGARDRALVTYPGAMDNFSARHIDMSTLQGHEHVHLTSYYLQRALQRSFPEILRRAKAEGLVTSFDPNSDPANLWSKSIKRVLQFTDVLFVNEREALKLTGARSAAQALKKLGESVPCVVVKLGRQGAIAMRDSQMFSAPGFKVMTVDTTGAGDSFDAGFMSAYLRGASPADCLRSGNACGALAASQAGGTAGQPDRRRLTEFLRTRNSQSSSRRTSSS